MTVLIVSEVARSAFEKWYFNFMGFYDFTIIVFSPSSICFFLKNLKVLKYTSSLVFITIPLGLNRFLFDKSLKNLLQMKQTYCSPKHRLIQSSTNLLYENWSPWITFSKSKFRDRASSFTYIDFPSQVIIITGSGDRKGKFHREQSRAFHHTRPQFARHISYPFKEYTVLPIKGEKIEKGRNVRELFFSTLWS